MKKVINYQRAVFLLLANWQELFRKKLTDGKPRDGKDCGLTLLNRDTIESFYGKCIRDNKGDVEALSKRIWPIPLFMFTV